ncbi:MAG: zf-HC2 domain-containing protein [Abditibacteriales bacterium]|nr:zf-HC2 domain-containing protein [Abditibacteriales bacterium]MDW8367339.1 zf-HC2 domain-containing protein [Abditibacteriales bacterium]
MNMCKWVAENLEKYEHGGLSDAVRNAVEKHLGACEGCRHLHERMTRIRQTLVKLERVRQAA